MFVVFCALSLILLAEAIVSLRKVFLFRKFFRREVSAIQQQGTVWPVVALLAPFKGIEPDLIANIQSWFAQDYPSEFKVFFIVESEKDPVLKVLSEFPQAVVFVAGEAQDCGQKVHNLRYAIEKLPSSYEIFLFVDSDCLLQPDWMRNLVRQIQNDPQNAATGYRWFTCQRNFGSVLRAVWNSSILTLYQEDGKNNFAWGGSMAITRTAFDSCGVKEAWQGSVSDDYSLTLAMQSKGKRVQFVPGAIARTTDCDTTRNFLRWAFRQLLITRIYYPRLWLSALVFHTVWLFWILIGLFYAPFFLPAFLIVQGIQALKGDLRWRCVPIGNRVYFWLTGPLIGLCNSFLLFATAFTRKIRWRGVEYVLDSTNHVTIVERRL